MQYKILMNEYNNTTNVTTNESSLLFIPVLQNFYTASNVILNILTLDNLDLVKLIFCDNIEFPS